MQIVITGMNMVLRITHSILQCSVNGNTTPSSRRSVNDPIYMDTKHIRVFKAVRKDGGSVSEDTNGANQLMIYYGESS